MLQISGNSILLADIYSFSFMRIIKKYSLLIITILSFSIPSCKKDPAINNIKWEATDSLKINQLQVIGSHNSYRLHTYAPMYTFVQNLSHLGMLPSQYNPDGCTLYKCLDPNCFHFLQFDEIIKILGKQQY